MKTAIIGLGNIGDTLARHLTAGGQSLILADKSADKASHLARELGATAQALPIAEAVREADVLILAVYLDAIKELLASYRSDFTGKIVIDPSNPIAPDGKGGFSKTIPAELSSGELVAALLPGDTELVKAFGTISADSLRAASQRAPELAVLFYATDYPEASRVVVKLIEASGFAPVSAGGIRSAIRIEVGGDLHEYGKLGKLVSVSEAKLLV